MFLCKSINNNYYYYKLHTSNTLVNLKFKIRKKLIELDKLLYLKKNYNNKDIILKINNLEEEISVLGSLLEKNLKLYEKYANWHDLAQILNVNYKFLRIKIRQYTNKNNCLPTFIQIIYKCNIETPQGKEFNIEDIYTPMWFGLFYYYVKNQYC